MKTKPIFRACYTKFPVWSGSKNRYALDENSVKLCSTHPTPERIKTAIAIVKECWIEARVDDRWMVAYRLIPQGGAAVVAEVRLFPLQKESSKRSPGEWSAGLLGIHASAPRGGIDARLLRKIRIGEHYSAGQAFLRWLQVNHPGSEEVVRDFGLEPPPGASDRHNKGTRRGRKPVPDKILLRIAKAYVKALSRKSRSPVADVSSIESMTKEKVRSMVHQARKRGLLTGTLGQGRRGGNLTEKALHLLARK